METNNKPDWYTKEEIHHFLRIKNYSEDIATELSVMWSDALNAAFNKGYQKEMKERDAKISELVEQNTALAESYSKLQVRFGESQSENQALKSELDKAQELLYETIGYFEHNYASKVKIKEIEDFLKDKR